MKQYVLGLDYGNTNLKAVAFDLEGRQCGACVVPGAPQVTLHPGWAEQDMEESWRRMVQAMHGLWKQGIDPAQVLAVGCSGFGGGAFLVGEDGKPVRAGITSMDGRVSQDSRFQDVVKAMNTDAMGGKPSNPALLLRWVKEYEPEVYRKIRWDMMSKDWIRFNLTGVAHCEPSDIGTNVFVSKDDMQYSEQVFDLLSVPEMYDRMPPLISGTEIGGYVTAKAAEETGLKAGVPVVGGGHDCVAASFGLGVSQTGEMSVSLGTFAVNLMMADNKPQPFAPGYPVRNCPSLIPGKWMLINQAHVGKAADWFINTMGRADLEEARRTGESVHTRLVQRALASKETDLIYLPYVAPLRDTPIRTARIGFYGANGETTYDELVRAMYEGVIFSEVYMLRLMTEVLSLRALNVTGGGAQNSLQCQILADLMGVPVVMPDVVESACRGAALAAAIGIGKLKDHAEAAALPVDIKQEYLPDAIRGARYREKYQMFLAMTEANMRAWKP